MRNCRPILKDSVLCCLLGSCLGGALFLSSLLLLPGTLAAQDLPEEASSEPVFLNFAELPEGVPPLPGPQETGTRLVVDHTNVASFHEVLLAPVVSWLKAEQLSFVAVSRLNFAWSLTPEWNQATENSNGAFDLAHDNSIFLDAKPLSLSGYPFGSTDRIAEVEDPTEKAFHILWNMAFAMLPTQDALYGVELQWIGKRKLIRKASGAFFRVLDRRLPLGGDAAMPSATVDAPSSGAEPALALPDSTPSAAETPEDLLLPANNVVFWQEVLKLFSPPGVYGYAAVAHRYFGPQEDDFWMYSPVLGRSRQVTASNRGDGIIGGILSLDDIFLWGMKTQAASARVVEEKTLLLPFPSLGMLPMTAEQVIVQLPQARKLENETGLAPEAGEVGESANLADSAVLKENVRPVEVTEQVLTARGYHRRSDQSSAMVLWNHESRLYLNNAAWVPTSVFFVPRKVWIVEVAPKDPYYLTGRQILVIDQESFLPFYKVIYDRSGEYKRMLMAGWSLATSEQGNTRLPIPGFVLAVSSGSEPSIALGVKYARTFLGKKTPAAAELYDLLDIEAHEQAANAQEDVAEHAADE